MPSNILLIVLDSLRAKNTSLQDYHRDTTPFISKFADENIHFHEARSPSVASLPSHVSMFTGLHTEEHGFGNSDHRDFVLKDGVTIWEQIADEHGYETGVFSTNPYLTTLSVGLSSAFDTVTTSNQRPFPKAVDPRKYYDQGETEYISWIRDCIQSGMPVRSLINGVSLRFSDYRRYKTVFPEKIQSTEAPALFLNWIDSLSDCPWAACINLMDTHTPYTPSGGYDRWASKEQRRFQDKIENFRWEFVGGTHSLDKLKWLENLYDGCILEADEKVRRIISGLRQRNVLDNTLVVITGDHGEGFGERSCIRPDQPVVGHTVGIHETQLHVPLVVHTPTTLDRRTREIDALATLTGFPTVVRNTIEGTNSPEEGFIPKEKVLAAQPALSEQNLEVAKSYGVQPESVSGKLQAVYERDEDSVFKHMSWGEITKTIKITQDSIQEVPEADTRKKNRDIFEDLERKDVKIKNFTETSGSVEQRLSELGYV
jgi:arylsulfatase